MNRAPILFIVFNRPDLTRRVFEMIRLTQPEVLYVACDAARAEKGQTEQKKVQEVKSIINKIDWPCKVQYKIAEQNLGCGKSVSQAIDWAFQHEDRLVILEDDCVPHIDFFRYCDELLELYKDDQRVGSIDGTSLLTPLGDRNIENHKYTYYFSRIPCVWGWATWKRVWKRYSFSMPDWSEIKKGRTLEKYWTTKENYDHVVAHLEMILSGQVDSWDFQLTMTLALQNQLVICPTRNLVENIGVGRDANLNKLKTRLNYLKTHPISWPLKHPAYITCQSHFDYLIERSYTHNRVFIKAKSLLFPLINKVLG